MFRIGTGHDTHRLAEGRPLVLGGVRLESDRGAVGHSDADALAHAVTDAELAARLGLREDDVRNHLAAARAELRQALRGEVEATTGDDPSLRAEWNELLGTRAET